MNVDTLRYFALQKKLLFAHDQSKQPNELNRLESRT